MLDKVYEQLLNRTNIIMVINGRAVAYAGWIRVNPIDAENWYRDGGNLPDPSWNDDAIIVTIVVTQDKNFLLPLIRAVSHVCAGKKVYRLRSFMGIKEDMRRPPIVGRSHKGLG